jgi:hypothetical protein
MTRAAPAREGSAPAIIDGVDVDAVAAAARRCAAVDDLCPGAWGEVVSYFPGRQVAGVRVASGHVAVSVRSQWDVPAAELARQLRASLAPVTGARTIDIIVADITDPGTGRYRN